MERERERESGLITYALTSFENNGNHIHTFRLYLRKTNTHTNAF